MANPVVFYPPTDFDGWWKRLVSSKPEPSYVQAGFFDAAAMKWAESDKFAINNAGLQYHQYDWALNNLAS